MDEAMKMGDSNGNPAHFDQVDPAEFMKHMDTSLENFFYQRPYTVKNFNFYL